MMIPVDLEELRQVLNALCFSAPMPEHEREHRAAMGFLTKEISGWPRGNLPASDKSRERVR